MVASLGISTMLTKENVKNLCMVVVGETQIISLQPKSVKNNAFSLPIPINLVQMIRVKTNLDQKVKNEQKKFASNQETSAPTSYFATNSVFQLATFKLAVNL